MGWRKCEIKYNITYKYWFIYNNIGFNNNNKYLYIILYEHYIIFKVPIH
jgi:hypothetical protein